MDNFSDALKHCFDAIDLGIDIESCLRLYPEHEEQLREFFRKWDGTRNYVKAIPESTLEQILFDQVLDACIKAVGNGESPANCYRLYPTYARKMKPWLDAVSELPKLRMEGLLQPEIIYNESITPEAPFTQVLDEYIQDYVKRLQFWVGKIPNQLELFLASLQPVLTKRLTLRFGNLFSNLPLQVPVAALLALLLFLFSGFGLVRAAAATIPGDSLYPLKLVVEQIHFKIVSDDQKAALQAQFDEERRREASALIQADIKHDVVFDGEITLIDQDKAMISNVVILLNELDGDVPVITKGERVHIEGYTGERGVVVKRIDVQSSEGAPPGSSESFPTSVPTNNPPPAPTSVPRVIPTAAPTTVKADDSTSETTSASASNPPSAPTSVPTDNPPPAPTSVPPTNNPPPAPTSVPTDNPPPAPTSAPTDNPPPAPTSVSIGNPTPEPILVPTDNPAPAPTSAPADNPTSEPISLPIVTAEPTNSQP
jgi:hypothetical protein